MDADILYIEDNEDYIEFVKKAFRKIDEKLTFHVIMDGTEALRLFEQNLSPRSLPRLILLDINLPGCNGLELLTRLRKRAATRYIPVVMFSTSENPDDMMHAFDAGANAYLVKPVGVSSLTDTLQSVINFWLNHNHTVANFAA
jgi:CheY-like chemotaxis protein